MSLNGRTFQFNEVLTSSSVTFMMNDTDNDMCFLMPNRSSSEQFSMLGMVDGELIILGENQTPYYIYAYNVWQNAGSTQASDNRVITFIAEPEYYDPSEEDFMEWFLANTTEVVGASPLSEFEAPDGSEYYFKDAQARTDIADLKDNQYSSSSAFPASGEVGKIYIAKDTNETYRWDSTTSDYVLIGSAGGGGSLLYILSFSILTTDWESITGGYGASITDSHVGTATDEIVVFDDSLTDLNANIFWEKNGSTHTMTFTSDSVPSDTISGKVFVFGDASGDVAYALPAVTSSDNGKVLGVVGGAWSKMSAPSGLPSVSASDNGKSLEVIGGSWGVGAKKINQQYTATLDMLSPKTWNGLTDFSGSYVWTDGTEIYYSNGSDQYTLNKDTSTWSEKTWNGLTNFDRDNIWIDGENIYYSNNDEHYVLNRATSTWSEKTWSGMTYFAGRNIWSDDENIYYSYEEDQYVLNKSTSTWEEKTWNGSSEIYGEYIWTDGENIYYTSYSTNLVLNKATSTWSEKTWSGFEPSDTDYIWTDGNSVYYSDHDDQYILNKATSTWEEKTWIDDYYIPYYGEYIWSDGENYYYSDGDEHYTIGSSRQVLIGENGEFAAVPASGVILPTVTADDDESVLEAKDGRWHVGAKKLEVNYQDWMPKAWIGLTSFKGSAVWTDDTDIYYSNETDQYVLDKATSTWAEKTWTGLTSFNGDNIWTDGTNIYYSNWSSHYVLNKATSTWATKTWTGMTNFYGGFVWTDGENTYYSRGSSQYVLDTSTSTWALKTWNGQTNFSGSAIWTDGENYYYSNGNNQYILDKATSTWSAKTWNGLSFFNGEDIWTGGENIYYSGYGQYVLNKTTSTWVEKTWSGTNPLGKDVWTDGKSIYYSDFDDQRVLARGDQLYVGTDGEFKQIDAEGKLLPPVDSSDEGKVLCVVNGVWAAVTIPSANGVSF